MSVTLPVSEDWPEDIPARSGLPPRNAIPGILDGQAVWLAARRRYTVFVPLCGGRDYQLTKTQAEDPATAGSTAICQVRIQVPPWTARVRWWVLSERDAAGAVCYTQRASGGGETYQHRIYVMGPGGNSLPAALLYPSDGVPDADDEPQDIHSGTTGWIQLTISVWLDGDAEIYGICFDPLAAVTITG